LKFSLAKKGLYLFLVPCFLQALYLVGLGIWQYDIEVYPLRSSLETEVAMDEMHFMLADLQMLRQIDHCWLHRLKPEVPCRDAEAAMTLAANKLKQKYMVVADERAAVIGEGRFSYNLPKMRQMYHLGIGTIDSISQSAQLALADTSACYKIDGDKPKWAIRNKAKLSWLTASNLLAQWTQNKKGNLLPPDRSSLGGKKYLVVVLGWSAINLLGMLIATFAFLRNVRSRLVIVLDNNERFAAGQPLNPPVGGSDEIALLDTSFHKMSDALQSHRREQTAIIENAQDLICSTDSQGKITAINAVCETLLGMRADALLGRWLIDIIDSDQQQETGDNLLQVASGKGQLTFETGALKKDGTRVDLLCSAVWDEEDQTIFCVFHDLRHKKLADRLQREVVEVACHELKTPILSISEFHHKLIAGTFGQLKQGTEKKIDSAVRCTERMITLVKDLEDCENLDTGKLQLQPSTFRIADLFNQTIKAVAEQGQIAKVTVVAEPTELQIYADPHRLLQILVNLTTNALKFSPAESTITLAARPQVTQTIIMVKDRGRGVPASVIDSIFDRFSQVRQSDSKVKGGTGLGLAICKSLVELHGGTIKVESEVDQGSVFSFTIPIIKMPACMEGSGDHAR
jgi:PAS domain S-box-containing protein